MKIFELGWPRMKWGLIGLAAGAIIFSFIGFSIHSKAIQIYNNWNLEINATSHASVLGLISGFIAAIVVIFLANPDFVKKEDRFKKHMELAIAIFVLAFLHCLLAAFLYATFAGYPNKTSNKTSNKTNKLYIRSGNVELGKNNSISSTGSTHKLYIHPTIIEAKKNKSEDNNRAPYKLYIHLFDIIGIQYFCGVFILFFGLALILECRSMNNFRGLFHLMTESIFFLGSYWVLGDILSGISSLNIWTDLVFPGLLYSVFRFLASILWIPKKELGQGKIPKIFKFCLYFSLLIGLMANFWFGYFIGCNPNIMDANFDIYQRIVVWFVTIFLGLFFMLIYWYRDTAEYDINSRNV